MKSRIPRRAVLLTACLLPAGAALAQTYPTQTARIIVPYQAGQGTDVVARYVAEELTKSMGQTFYVENKPGAGGNIGAEAGARAAPDGYTLTMGTNATHGMNEFLYPSTGFSAERDFVPIILVGMLPMVIAANLTFAANSVQDMVAAARARPDKIDVALPSTTARIVFELLKERTGAPLFGVPYKGSATAMTEVMGGQVPLIVDTITALRSHLEAGKLKALGITTLKPSDLLAGVKPVAEQGVPGFETTAWLALYVPHGTPSSIVGRLNAEVARILALPEMRQRLLKLGFEPGGGTPSELAAFGSRERDKWGPVIKAAGLRGD